MTRAFSSLRRIDEGLVHQAARELDVEQVAALHGPCVATLAELAASVRPAVTPSR